MGLDMNLSSVKRLPYHTFQEMMELESHMHRDEELQKKYAKLLTNRFDVLGMKSIVTELIYWRKANQIHSWFVQNVQKGDDNCDDYVVTKKQLTKLLDLCYKVDEVFKQATIIIGPVVNGQRIVKGKWENIYEDGEVYTDLDVDKIRSLLPPTAGFFFGNTDINKWYYQDILHTIAKLEHVITTVNFKTNFVFYGSSW